MLKMFPNIKEVRSELKSVLFVGETGDKGEEGDQGKAKKVAEARLVCIWLLCTVLFQVQFLHGVEILQEPKMCN